MFEEEYKELEKLDKRMEEINELLKEADEFDNIDEFEQFEYRTEQENAIYEKTKAFGRTQFVREIASQINSNKKLENDINLLKKEVNSNVDYIDELQNDLFKLTIANKELHNKIDKAIELSKQVIKDTKDFYRPTCDTIYSGDTLIDIAEQNLEILKDSDVDE